MSTQPEVKASEKQILKAVLQFLKKKNLKVIPMKISNNFIMRKMLMNDSFHDFLTHLKI